MKLALHLALLLGAAAFTFAQKAVPDDIATAAMRGDVASVRSLVDRDGGPRGQAGTTALLNSARVGQLAVIKAMCEAGADPNRPGVSGALPLLIAIGARQPAAARLLLEHGADPNKEGLCLETKCARHPALPLAVYVGDADSVKALLAKGADVAWHEHQATQAANMNGDVELFSLLKRAGGREWTEHPAVKLKLAEAVAAAAREQARVASPIAPSALGFTELLPAKAVPTVPRAAGKKCRMAILADEANRAAADLLTARLTGSGSVELVERAEIEKILTEQKLAREFSADAANAAQLGSLLRADALVFIGTRKVGEQPLVETRVVRVNPGMILDTAYRPAPLGNPSEWAKQAAERIAPLASKSIARDGVAFSILNLRSTLGSVASRLLEQKAAALLTDRLVHHPQFHVLERSTLDRLTREIGMGGKAAFWTGSYLLDGSIDVAGGAADEMTLTIRLQSTGAEKARTFTRKGRVAQLPALLDALVVELAGSLGKTLLKPVDDLPAEAAAYTREAAWAKACGMPAAASAAAETAWALGDHSAEVARLRVEMASKAVEHQAERTTSAMQKGGAWSSDSEWITRDLLNHPLRPADALPEETVVNLATRAASAWRETLAAPPEGIERVEWLRTGMTVFQNALMGVVMVDTSAAKIRLAEPLRNLKAELLAALDAARTASKDTPLFVEFCMFKASNVHALFDSPAAVADHLSALLPLHFATDDLLTRARLRHAIFSAAFGGEYVKQVTVAEHGIGGGSSHSFGLRFLSWFPDRALELFARKVGSAQVLEDQLLGRGLLFRRQVAGFRLPSEFDRTLESAWELRHLIAQDTRSLQYYLGMLWPRPLFASAETGSRTIPGTKLRRPATLPPGMVKLRRDYFIALCEERALLDDSVGLLLDPDLYDDAQKQAATVAIEAHLARVNGTAGLPADYAVEWRKPAGPDRKSVPSVPGVSKALRSTNAEPLHIDRLWLEPKPDQDGLSVTNCLYQAVWAENAIWFFSETEGEFDRTKPRTASVQRLDLESFQMKAFPMPKQPGDANGHRAQTRVLVTPALLVVTCPGRYLALCDRASGKWEYFPAIKPDGVGVLLDDRFFIPVKDEQSAGVMSFDLATKTTELLVSSRRNPAISPLDDPGLRLKAAFANEAGDFVLTVSSIAPDGRKGPFWAWSPSARTWRESGSEKPAKDFTRRMDGFINLGTVQPVSEAQEDGDLRMVMNQMGGWVIKGLPLLVEFKRPPGVVFTKYGFTSSTGQPTSRRPEMWRQCPQGYFFVSDNRRLWFLPQEQFDAFTKASSKTKSE